MWDDDYTKDDDSSGFADPLADVGFIVAVIIGFAVFCAVMFYGVPAAAQWFVEQRWVV